MSMGKQCRCRPRNWGVIQRHVYVLARVVEGLHEGKCGILKTHSHSQCYTITFPDGTTGQYHDQTMFRRLPREV